MRALVVTNMYPTAERPAPGVFVRDQVTALRRHPGVEVEVFRVANGSPASYLAGLARLAAQRRRGTGSRFDVVHAHFGLSIVPSLGAPGRVRVVTLHGTDLAHPRSRAITLASLRFVDLVATVSEPLAAGVPPGAFRGPRAVLPCGVDLDRFRAIPRPEARAALGLDPSLPHLLFPSDPRRPEKRFDHASAVASAVGVPLLALTGVRPEQVPLWINAANAVLVPSDREGFGLAVLEALACEVPVLATPAGVAPEVLDGMHDTLCAPFDAPAWSMLARRLCDAPDPRVARGRERAARFSSDAMAERVLGAWTSLLRDH